MDILIEVLLEVYMELMFLIIPESKRKRKHRVIAVIIAIVCTFGLMALAGWGVYLVAEHNNRLGIIPIVIAVILSCMQIGLGIYLRSKSNKKN